MSSSQPQLQSASSSLNTASCKISGSKMEFRCKPCKLVVGDHQSAIQCDSCPCWFHSECVGLNKNDMKTVKKAGIHWYCEVCNNTLSRLNKQLESIEKHVVSLSQTQPEGNTLSGFNAKLESIEKQIVSLNQAQSDKPAYSDMVQHLNGSIKQNLGIGEQVSKQGQSLNEQVSIQSQSLNEQVSRQNRELQGQVSKQLLTIQSKIRLSPGHQI